MYKLGKDGLAHDANGNPVAVAVDSFTTGIGVDAQSDIVILRLYRKDWQTPGGILPTHQVHQFGIPAPQAAALGRFLLELAAQAEKETGETSH